MSDLRHPNYIKASNLVLWSLGVYILSVLVLDSTYSFGNMVFGIIVLGVIAVLVRAGYPWMKYVLGVMLLFALILEPFVIMALLAKDNGMVVLSNIIQIVLQIIVVVKLWQIPNTPPQNLQAEPIENVVEEEDTLEE